MHWWLPPWEERLSGVVWGLPILRQASSRLPCGCEHVGTYAVSTIVKQECEQILKNDGATLGLHFSGKREGNM